MKKKNLIDLVYPVAVWYGACAEVAGFDALYALLCQRISLSGKSQSTLKNYARHLAKMALQYVDSRFESPYQSGVSRQVAL